MREQIIRSKEDFNSFRSMKYLADTISNESLNELVDTLSTFAEEHIVDNDIMIKYLTFVATIIALITDDVTTALECNIKQAANSYHVDTQERENGWRVQIMYPCYGSGLCEFFRGTPELVKNYTVYLSGIRGITPKLTICNGEIIFTDFIKKKNGI